MATQKQISNALNRVERLKSQQKAAVDKLDRLLGAGVRDAIKKPRSAWATYADRPLREFYAAVAETTVTTSDSDVDADVGGSSRTEVGDSHHAGVDSASSSENGYTDHSGSGAQAASDAPEVSDF